LQLGAVVGFFFADAFDAGRELGGKGPRADAGDVGFDDADDGSGGHRAFEADYANTIVEREGVLDLVEGFVCGVDELLRKDSP